ncbi:MAG: hypothetical protein Q8K45_01715 [Rubrivivax sp.]|nr:hypothetical protein [Rubrivivax sp.]
MFKPLLIAAAVALSFAAADTARAQAAAPASAAKKELVARVLQLQQPGIEAMARQLAEQPARQLLQGASQQLQRLPTERREAVARDIEADVRKYVDEAAPIVRDRAVKLAPSTIGALLEERFTEDELKQIIATLESPVNRKFQGMAGDMQRAIGEKLVAETRGEIESKVRALDQTVARRLGITPASGAASGSKPAAPAKKP